MNTELEQMREVAERTQAQLARLELAINDSIDAYERHGEVTSLEGCPLIYAQVLLDIGEMIK